MDNKMETFCQNPMNILKVIGVINQNFSRLMEKYAQNSPHRDPYQYFMTGSCAAYAQILHEIFSGYAEYYDMPGHILNKIGNFYFDVGGINYEPNEPNSEYRDCPDEYFDMVTAPYWRKDGIEKKLIPELIEIGKQALEKYLNELNIAEENGKTR